MQYVIMGVAGCGKSSLGKALADRTGWQFIEGDDFHGEGSRSKMEGGQGLTDEDRWPWLDQLASMLHGAEQGGKTSILACSALKVAYRKRLAEACPVRFIFLDGDPGILEKRLQGREGHFAGPALLPSQLKTLEKPQDALVVDLALPLETQVNIVLTHIKGQV